ncbi:MAG: 50S ribosomal protein L13 [Candidatus Edwardsbacteria bacterium]|jgi:large subunit ribosomal protein L13|nr:50S ribosomal protein L13 [Candidatus Edwardsbacteria bacterium]
MKTNRTTYFAKAGELPQRWYVIDATGRSLGRLATRSAMLLRGKTRPQFTPHLDCGDHVVVINAAKVRLTGAKLADKRAYRHSGYQGGLRTIDYGKLLKTRPTRVIELAVKGMLPHTIIGRSNYRKLHVYAGETHPHAAQKPTAITL